jgi:hypothetical protein
MSEPQKRFSYIEQGLAEEAARPKPRGDTTVIRLACGSLAGLLASVVLWAWILHLDAGVLRAFIANSQTYWTYASLVTAVCGTAGILYGAVGRPLKRTWAGAAIVAPLGLLAGTAVGVRFDVAHAAVILRYNPTALNLDDFPTGILVGLAGGVVVGALLGVVSAAFGQRFSRVFLGALFFGVGTLLIRGYWVNTINSMGLFDPDVGRYVWTNPQLVLPLAYGLAGGAVGGLVGAMLGQVGYDPAAQPHPV